MGKKKGRSSSASSSKKNDGKEEIEAMGKSGWEIVPTLDSDGITTLPPRDAFAYKEAGLDKLGWKPINVTRTEIQEIIHATDATACMSLESVSGDAYEVVNGVLTIKNSIPNNGENEETKAEVDTSREEQNGANKKKKRAKKNKKAKDEDGAEAVEPAEEKTNVKDKKRKKGDQEEKKKVPKKRRVDAEKKKETETATMTEDESYLEKMSNWLEFGLHSNLLQGLAKLDYLYPTPIQRLCLGKGLNGCDILGAAETGSGKTLAFGLPVLHGLLKSPPKPGEGLSALVLTPTRELAVQVTKHFKAVLGGDAGSKLKIGSLLGGMALPKQERVLSQRPEIIVATPGRLWAFVEQGQEHLGKLHETLRYLVIDEADRMFDKGHFPELKPLVELFVRAKKEGKPVHKRQTFLFSATLMLKDATKPQKVGKMKKEKIRFHGKKTQSGNNSKSKNESPLFLLMKEIGLRGKPAVCTVEEDGKTKQAETPEKEEKEQPTKQKKEKMEQALTEQVKLPEKLKMCKVHCTEKDKELYLYYFLTQYKGRTLIFVNTISSLKRVAGVLKVLKVPKVTTLHANMQQKQRLKHLERFTGVDDCVLVATDVAARGLDISNIDYVVHFAIPKSLDSYVHRSGRTARASKKGLSLSLVSPTEQQVFQTFVKAIGEDRFHELDVHMAFLPKVKDRVSLARRIEQLERNEKNRNSDKDWFMKNAEAADMILEDELINDSKYDSVKKSQEKELQSLRNQLNVLLQERLIPKGVSSKYISNNVELHESMLRGEGRDVYKDL